MDQLVVTASFTVNDLKTSLSDIYRKISKPNAPPRVFIMTDS